MNQEFNDIVTMRVSGRFVPQILEYIEKLEQEEIQEKLRVEYNRKGCDFWNSKLEFIQEQINKDDSHFKWNQLVWQEIWMFASIAKPVERNQFKLLCERRGFNDTQVKFLEDAINYMGIGWCDKEHVYLLNDGIALKDEKLYTEVVQMSKETF